MITVKPPDYLGDKGKEKWKQLTEDHEELSDKDSDTLGLLCSAWETFQVACCDILKTGIKSTNKDGRGYNNPAVNVKASMLDRVVSLSKQLSIIVDKDIKTKEQLDPIQELIEQ